MERAAQDLSILYAVMKALAASNSLAQMSRLMLAEICGALGWHLGALWLIDESSGVLRCQEVWCAEPLRGKAFEQLTRKANFPPGVGLPGRVWAQREPVWVPDITGDANFPRASVAAQDGLHGAFGVPIESGDRLLGVIEFFDGEIRAPDPDLLHLFAAIGAQIGLAVDRTRTRERSEKRLHFLAEAGAALAGSLDYEATLARVAELAVEALADHCVIQIADDQGVLRPVAVQSRSPQFETHWVAPGAPERLEASAVHPDAVALRTGRPVLYERVGEQELLRLARTPEHLNYLRSLGLRQWLSAPLLARRKALGVMAFGVSAAERRWDLQDLTFVEEIASRAAVAVENARLYREAEKAVRTRDEFLSTVAHDLRNPLSAIKGLAQLLRRRALLVPNADTASSVGALERIDTAATKMTTLLDELLEVSGLRIGQPLELSRAQVDLVALTRDVVASFPAGDRHTIEVHAEPSAIVAHVDGSRMERVLTNLLTNATKYSPNGGRIRVAVAMNGAGAVIAVTDEGLGIPARDLPSVFEPFKRGSNVAESIPGTGIGLTAARQIVQLHGGKIEVESVEGSGTTFWVRLPLAAVEAAQRAEAGG